MADFALSNHKDRWTPLGMGALAWTYFAAITAVTLISTPWTWAVEALSWLGGAAPAAITVAVIAAAFALVWLSERVEERPGGVFGFILSAGAWGAAGFFMGVTHELFARTDLLDVFVRAPSLLEFAALGLGGIFLAIGLTLPGAMSDFQREDPDGGFDRHDKGLIGFLAPIFIGEGVLIALLALSRLLDWSTPGLVHGLILFLAGAAFLASIVFSAWIYFKMDEQERDLVYRQNSVTFTLAFFLFAGWALAEAAGLAPALDAFSGFLLLNAVYLGVGLPWSTRRALREAAETE